MRKLYIALLFLFAYCSAYSQKINFRVHASANHPLIADIKEEFPVTVVMQPSMYQVIDGKEGSLTTNFKEKPGMRFGSTVLINLTDKISLEAGMQANVVRFNRTIKLEPPVIADKYTGVPEDPENGEGIYRRWRTDPTSPQPGSNRSFVPAPEPDPKVGNHTMLYLEIPQAVKYRVSRYFELKTGFTTAVLAYSERYTFKFNSSNLTYYPTPYPGTDPYDPYFSGAGTPPGNYEKTTNSDGLTKVLIALNAGVTFKISEHIGLDLDYAKYLTSIYETQANKPKPKYHLFSLGLSHAF